MIEHVAGHEYDNKSRELAIVFDSGRRIVYHNVGVTGYMAFALSESQTIHWQRYIEPCYIKVNRVKGQPE